MALNTWVDRIDGVDVQTADDINMVAHAVIDIENNFDGNVAKMTQKDKLGNIINDVYANSIVNNVNGVSIIATDVSKIEHELNVKVESKNLLKFPYATMGTYEQNGLTFTVLDDGGISVQGSQTGTARIVLARDVNFGANNITSNLSLEYVSNGEYTGSVGVYYDASSHYVALRIRGNDIFEGGRIFYPQIERGTLLSNYTPYIDDVSGIKVSVYEQSSPSDKQVATSDKNGNISGLKSVYPNMIIETNNPNASVVCDYNADTKKYIDNAISGITNAIISMGGNI